MPHNRANSKVDTAEIFRLHDSGMSQGAIERQTGVSQGYISRLLKWRRETTSNGHLPAIQPSQPIATHRNEPVQALAIPSPSIAADVDTLKSQVDTLWAFMEAMQAQQRIIAMPSQPIASQPIATYRSEQIPWVSRGFQVATDMADAIDTYARDHGLWKREVLDLALRRFFAAEGGGDA